MLVSLTTLGVLALQSAPGPEPSGNAARPIQTENARALLDEEAGANQAAPEKAGESDVRKTGIVRLSVPRLGISDLRVPTGETQAELNREGIIRLGEGGLPNEKGSNTFIVGHALGYPSTQVRFVFRHLEKMKPGDEITLSLDGERYTYKVYDRLTVRPLRLLDNVPRRRQDHRLLAKLHTLSDFREPDRGSRRAGRLASRISPWNSFQPFGPPRGACSLSSARTYRCPDVPEGLLQNCNLAPVPSP